MNVGDFREDAPPISTSGSTKEALTLKIVCEDGATLPSPCPSHEAETWIPSGVVMLHMLKARPSSVSSQDADVLSVTLVHSLHIPMDVNSG